MNNESWKSLFIGINTLYLPRINQSMRGNMETTELGNLNRGELFEELKDKCKSRSQLSFYCGLLLLFLIVVAIIYTGLRGVFSLNDIDGIISFLLIVLLGCAVGWSVLYNYRFIKKTDIIDTPEQLLYCYEKKTKNDKVFFIALGLVLIGNMFSYIHLYGENTNYLRLGFWIVFFVSIFLIYYRNGFMRRKDKDILELLWKLVGKK